MLILSPASYIAAGLFLAVMTFLYYLALGDKGVAYADETPLSIFFQGFFFPVCFFVPLLTMRTLAEERRLGTLQSMLSTAASATQIVLSKYLAAYVFYLGIWSLTLGFPLLLEQRFPEVVTNAGLLEASTLAGGYAFIAISGLLYVAVGVFCSGLTQSQLVAGMLAFFALFVLTLGPLMVEALAPLSAPELSAAQSAASGVEAESLGLLRQVIEHLREALLRFQAFDHLNDFSRGVVDTRPIVLYLSGACLLVGVTVLNVEASSGSPT